MKFAVYCDESRHSGGKNCQFAVIGGLWIRADLRDGFSQILREIRSQNSINSEIKWSKVSRLKISAYQKLVEAFFSNEGANFRAIVIDQANVRSDIFHNGDNELGFYKFYYEMLEKWITSNNQYNILLDYKNNSDKTRLIKLRECVANYARPRRASISNLTSIDSRQSHIAQLCDLLTGAIAADANGVGDGTPKSDFIKFATSLRGCTSLSAASASPEFSKFNVFRIALKAVN